MSSSTLGPGVGTCNKCHTQIVWIDNIYGKHIMVNRNTYNVGDTLYDRSKHTSHFTSCPGKAQPPPEEPTSTSQYDKQRVRNTRTWQESRTKLEAHMHKWEHDYRLLWGDVETLRQRADEMSKFTTANKDADDKCDYWCPACAYGLRPGITNDDLPSPHIQYDVLDDIRKKVPFDKIAERIDLIRTEQDAIFRQTHPEEAKLMDPFNPFEAREAFALETKRPHPQPQKLPSNESNFSPPDVSSSLPVISDIIFNG